MRTLWLTALCAATALSSLAVGNAAVAAPALMPVPKSARLSGQAVPVSGGFAIQWQSRPSPLLKRAADRFATRFTQIAVGAPVTGAAALPLTIRYAPDSHYLSVDEREDYTLTVAPGGVTLTATGPAGVLHGFATLLQLIEKTPQGPVLAGGRIEDAPRFRWRGVMIDVARHFMSVEAMERQIDAMELTKLNVLHWHLSDGTGFRVESRRYPKLQMVGGHHQFYTQAQVRAIVRYAADRGVRIVPEFDVPGHTLAVLQAYPDLAAQQPVPLTQSWLKTCDTDFNKGATTTTCGKHINLNNAALDPTNPGVLAFIGNLYAEMAGLFPDQYFHTGGDEVVSKQWTANPKIAAYMKARGYADAPAMQAAFTAEVQKVLAKAGKVMMGWDEVSEAPIPKNVVVEVWRSSKWTGKATADGHPVVVSAGYYLDLLRPSRQHYLVDPYDLKAQGLTPADLASMKNVFKLGDAFAIDETMPPLTEAQKKLVMGGEAPLWSEIVSNEMLDARLWPRGAAIAERYWSPASVRNVDDMELRLPAVMVELEATGLKAEQKRQWMTDRLSPVNVTPVKVLTDATRPVMNYAMNRLAAKDGDAMLRAPAAIAEPDSFVGIRFNRLAARYAAGDAGVEPELKRMLDLWAGNDQAFQAIATSQALKDALPVSRLLSALAVVGLEALEPGNHQGVWRTHAQGLIDQAQAAIDSCAKIGAVDKKALPQSGLLIAFLPGIKSLVDAAK